VEFGAAAWALTRCAPQNLDEMFTRVAVETFIDIVGLLVVIAVLYIALPLLIVWLMDRRGIIGVTVSMAVGFVGLLFGVIIILWVAYNLIWPTEEFERSVGSYFAIPFRLLLPIAFIFFGWRWLRNDGPGIEEEKPLASEPELLLARMIAHTRLAEFISALPTEEHSLALVLAMAPDPQSAEGAEGLRDVADDYPSWLEVRGYQDGEFILQVPSLEGEEDPSQAAAGPWDTSVRRAKSWIGKSSTCAMVRFGRVYDYCRVPLLGARKTTA
jgi:hypothetical protein